MIMFNSSCFVHLLYNTNQAYFGIGYGYMKRYSYDYAIEYLVRDPGGRFCCCAGFVAISG